MTSKRFELVEKLLLFLKEKGVAAEGNVNGTATEIIIRQYF